MPSIRLKSVSSNLYLTDAIYKADAYATVPVRRLDYPGSPPLRHHTEKIDRR